MSFRFIESIAESRIREAMQSGAFENLEGRGKPLEFEDDSMIPDDLKMSYKILRNAGCLPPELEESKEIGKMIELLDSMQDEGEKYRQIRKLNLMITKMNINRRIPVNLEKDQLYYEKVVNRVNVAGKNKAK